ncbi:uncharacterized protein EI90DRAFT_3287509 [Cantharellus anzutake]|uniref:uncharacterized protein n=1 Tax=Cantharellus anzutake TaxID=1750568 RepID=UPI0019082D60|nr:uncharacterized protein EI90DRAFT_3287509 [Cantharellus anzutake]KAF8336433.1 hypothetical protein EI90DRAFT_3287509 [Cantharellus anzutake]
MRRSLAQPQIVPPAHHTTVPQRPQASPFGNGLMELGQLLIHNENIRMGCVEMILEDMISTVIQVANVSPTRPGSLETHPWIINPHCIMHKISERSEGPEVNGMVPPIGGGGISTGSNVRSSFAWLHSMHKGASILRNEYEVHGASQHAQCEVERVEFKASK